MKLSFWNWIHLLAPYFIALYCYKNWEEGFLGWLFLGYLLTEMITMVPYMDRDVKTGKSFKTKYGRIEEYKTVKGESANDMGDMTSKIHLAHFLGIILLIIYGIYSIFSSTNVNQSNSSTYDKNEDTLAVASSEYNGENDSDTSISEYNVEDSTNINVSENNEEIDTAESVSSKVLNIKHELNSDSSYDQIYELNSYSDFEPEFDSKFESNFLPKSNTLPNDVLYDAPSYKGQPVELIESELHSEKAYKDGERRLNIIFNKVISVLTDEEKVKLKQDQTQWVKWRNRECNESAKITSTYKFGYEASLYFWLLEKTELRIVFLNKIFFSKSTKP